MEDNRYDKGIEVLGKMVDEEVLNKTINWVKQFSPDIANLIVEIPFGTIYSRPGLTLQQRSLMTITALITTGASNQLDFHIHGALNVGLTPQEIIEAIIHTISYSGFPKAVDAVAVVMKVFKERGITLD
ncbi:carboxymuconolactone decarboxylase family protein [Paenibacillus sp. SYP-B3998]|uniref:Carboxymuconolactone decarboxylase family protein n=1 Tax=Paenibacillus sp. SYP-B3998 TaxID=2678564 RepID=A0A6G4A5C0_9BACL|nr:carboxymuconolactone decarboxylase family protein [Paenibacillus sp. SYP-B3998]NEW09488.1 carboxymuconolactone decarboxylase family protein [Paenibacillus sp. SYP-B3998]